MELVLGIVGVAAGGWLTWISVQSLRQAALLNSAAKGPPEGLVGKVAAIHGTVRVTEPVHGVGGPCLWVRQVIKERRGYGKNRRWVTVSDESKMAGCFVQTGGGEIEIFDLPTEVQGQQSKTEYDQWFFSTSKQIDYWLPIYRNLTVLGRVEKRGRLGVAADTTMGLLLSPRPPGEAAMQEALKGGAGLMVVVAGLIAGVWYVLAL